MLARLKLGLDIVALQSKLLGADFVGLELSRGRQQKHGVLKASILLV